MSKATKSTKDKNILEDYIFYKYQNYKNMSPNKDALWSGSIQKLNLKKQQKQMQKWVDDKDLNTVVETFNDIVGDNFTPFFENLSYGKLMQDFVIATKNSSNTKKANFNVLLKSFSELIDETEKLFRTYNTQNLLLPAAIASTINEKGYGSQYSSTEIYEFFNNMALFTSDGLLEINPKNKKEAGQAKKSIQSFIAKMQEVEKLSNNKSANKKRFNSAVYGLLNNYRFQILTTVPESLVFLLIERFIPDVIKDIAPKGAKTSKDYYKPGFNIDKQHLEWIEALKNTGGTSKVDTQITLKLPTKIGESGKVSIQNSFNLNIKTVKANKKKRDLKLQDTNLARLIAGINISQKELNSLYNIMVGLADGDSAEIAQDWLKAKQLFYVNNLYNVASGWQKVGTDKGAEIMVINGKFYTVQSLVEDAIKLVQQKPDRVNGLMSSFSRMPQANKAAWISKNTKEFKTTKGKRRHAGNDWELAQERSKNLNKDLITAFAAKKIQIYLPY